MESVVEEDEVKVLEEALRKFPEREEGSGLSRVPKT